MLTPEQKTANEAVEAAIVDYLRIMGLPSDEMPGDWLVVVSTIGWDEDGDPKNGYYMMFPNGSVPNHIAHGLLHEAKHLLDFGRSVDDAD